MVNLALCRWCGESGHLVDACPERQPLKVKIEEVVKEKRKWVKPKLTVWKKAEVFTPCEQVVNKVESVNTVCEQPVNRKEYRREWMRKRREREKANRGG